MLFALHVAKMSGGTRDATLHFAFGDGEMTKARKL
jgi:hypothetical protein